MNRNVSESASPASNESKQLTDLKLSENRDDDFTQVPWRNTQIHDDAQHVFYEGQNRMPVNDEAYQLMTVEQVQKALKRSRASIYRYANTESGDLNPPIDPNRLNPEPRRHKDEPLTFALSEVERFAKHVLGIRGITIEVQESPDYANQELMKEILQELKAIRSLLESSTKSTIK
ncbi:MAG: hypothetical protein AAF327_24045 [Cyanobacteria bacterium P01_A01_bin.37]